MRNFLNIVSISRWNFESVLMRLIRISIKVFTKNKTLLGLRENFEKILEDFRVYFAEIILSISEENFEKVLRNCKNFMVISEKFWLNWENNEKIFGEVWRFFQEIVKTKKIYTMSREVSKNFWKIFWIKKCIKF